MGFLLRVFFFVYLATPRAGVPFPAFRLTLSRLRFQCVSDFPS